MQGGGEEEERRGMIVDVAVAEKVRSLGKGGREMFRDCREGKGGLNSALE